MIPRPLWAILAACLFFSACGYVGGPLAPLANIPSAVADLAAQQRGGEIFAHFTVPAFTTEHVGIKEPLSLDLRIGVWPEHVGVESWAASAKPVSPISPAPPGQLANYKIPAAEWAGKEVVIAARVKGSNEKESNWSNYVVVPVVAAPEQPKDLKAESEAKGVRLTWRANGQHFRILRKTGDETQYAIVAPDETQQEWTDTQAAPGNSYIYMVQTVVPLGGGKSAESELSEVKITPSAPPPAAPTGLLAVPAPNSIELTWETAGAEAVGYRVYRANGPGNFAKVADVNAIPTYSDRAIEHGKTYRYAVSAIDQAGREGPRSAIVEVVMP